MKICKVCGELNASESKYCVNCGSESFEVSDVKQKICPDCGSVCEPQFTHCVNCGAALGDANVSGIASFKNGGAVAAEPENSDETVVCPYCGAEISLHTIFCAGCGHDVTSLNKHKVVKRKICRFCGKPNKPEDKFCKYCFYDLRDGETVDFQLDYADEQDKNLKLKQAVLQAPTTEKLKICPNCGSLNRFDSVYCFSCGLKLVTEAPKTYCFVCGAENLADAAFCTSCRYPLGNKSHDEVAKGWKCECGEFNERDDKFCTGCGRPKPTDDEVRI